ncbi:MAG TPA: primosomal protein N' [Eubacterium sp.]|nr:primosomal protein N' [Eubacterium sp.]
MYADVIIDISHEQLDKTFQYAVPDELVDVIELGMSVDIPFGAGNRQITGYVVGLGDKAAYPVEKIKYITGITEGKVTAVSRMLKLAAWLKHNYGCTMNQAIKTVIPVKDKVKQKEKHSVNLIIDAAQAQKYLDTFAKKNAKARYRLLEALIKEPVIDESIIKSKLNITAQTVKAFEDMGIAEVRSEDMYRNPVRNVTGERKRIELNEQQKNAVDTIIADYDNGDYKTYLLHGVTGSGKTEVYLETIEHVLNHGRQAIVLIPEIALTFQTVQRFYHRFGDKVSIMNSRMSKGERYDQFLRAMRGEISIMIGPRSALFTPFTNLGLIIMDEEHEGAYKSEQAPRYHARETAVHIAKMCGAGVVFGSATPSVEAFYRAKKNEYTLLELPRRASGTLPAVYTVDLREELKCGNRSVFSRRLQELIQRRLAAKEQIILFLNKRGYAGFVSCRMCGHVLKCPHCDISLTEHKNGKMVCHYCGYEQPRVTRCPVCGSKYISGFRAGTQQIEEAVKKMYPQARVLRMDMDTTAGKEGHEKILAAFSAQEADILVGTQMIVKGHDFPNVTLVGVLAADMSLYAGDYRAAERTFELLTQAAGRAGRGRQAGEVVIQTYTPQHYSIAAAAAQNYEQFYEEEIAFRSIMDYPPVCNMLMVTLSSKNEEQLLAACTFLKEVIPEWKKEQVRITGPVAAGVYKRNDYYNQVVYLKATAYEKLTACKDRLETLCRENTLFRSIGLQFDFN